MNNLAAVSENEQKMIDAGALQHYVKLLSPQYDQSIQREVARALFTLAFKHKDDIIASGCADGQYIVHVLTVFNADQLTKYLQYVYILPSSLHRRVSANIYYFY